jgi:hypothetical protein
MIYGYFDESGETGDGFFVVAGFVGRRKDWKTFLGLWSEGLGNRTSLHMKDLRLGSSRYPYRHRDLLIRLGSIPRRANLIGFAGSVRTSDYAEKIKGTVAEIGLSGYSVALVAMVDAILESNRISNRDRIEFTFEDQFQFAIPRAATFRDFRLSKHYKTHHGKSRVGKDSAMAASMILEASDYLSYAILQQLIDPNSQKAKLTSPILEASKPVDHVEITKDNVEYLIRTVYSDYGKELPKMDSAKKKYILEKLSVH